MPKLKITLTKSPIGYNRDQGATVRSLGLKRMQHTVHQDDNAVIRGMVHKVRHLVTVTQILEEQD